MKEYEMIVIGGGAAGLSAAIEAKRHGVNVLLIDSNDQAGGQLVKQTHKFFGAKMHRAGTRGFNICKELLKESEDLGVEVLLNALVMGIYDGDTVAVDVKVSLTEHKLMMIKAQNIVISTGASENAVRFEGWTLPGVMGAGAAQTMVNYRHVLPGRKMLMIGSGNVGLIVSYQLMQAGVEIKGIVEALPKITGWQVHASKLTREGIHIYTGYTIKKAHGTERVTGATIARVNPDWSLVPGSEIEVDCDFICIGAGLKPLTGLAHMAGCELMYDKALGGWAPAHNYNMETTRKGIYVAGDATGLEEASTAIEEGTIAGAAIAEATGHLNAAEAEERKAGAWRRLADLRDGFHGEERLAAKNKQLAEYDRLMGVRE